ncbi:PqqD family protein [Roseomonas nepalensis]|uniref:PqqD family protein n=2 Tax=Muricoccus nepalensis TaxID=1854500 RepID=A0A502FSC3_9PROT|nr:PqqD family protein [Roseomonas nepalensis]
MVFDPERPGLCLLNPTAWLVLELCENRTEQEIVSLYADLFGNRLGRAEAGKHVSAGLQTLAKWALLSLPQEQT